MNTRLFTDLPVLPPLTSHKVRHPASTAANPAFIEVFDWKPEHVRPAVVLTASFGVPGQSLGEAMRSFVLVRAYDLRAGAGNRNSGDRWCWWDDFIAALAGPSDLSPELTAARAQVTTLERAIDDAIRLLNTAL